jgi:hypothetical protein
MYVLSNNNPRPTLKYKSVFYNQNFGSGMRAYPIRHAMKHEQALSASKSFDQLLSPVEYREVLVPYRKKYVRSTKEQGYRGT